MDRSAPANKTSPLKQVQEKFGHWRRSRKKRGTIPDALWQAAVMLFPDYRLDRISKAFNTALDSGWLPGFAHIGSHG